MVLKVSLLRTFLKWLQFVTVCNRQYKKKKASISAGFLFAVPNGLEPSTSCVTGRQIFQRISLIFIILHLYTLVLRKI